MRGERRRTQSYGAEPGATANGMACHGSCSEQHAPRQATPSLSFNVRQKSFGKYTWSQLGHNLGFGVGDSNYPKKSKGYYSGTSFVDRVEAAAGGRGRNPIPVYIDGSKCRRAANFLKNDRFKTAKIFSNPRMKAKGDFEDCDCAARVEGRNLTEPNQSLQRMRKRGPLVESKDSGPHR